MSTSKKVSFDFYPNQYPTARYLLNYLSSFYLSTYEALTSYISFSQVLRSSENISNEKSDDVKHKKGPDYQYHLSQQHPLVQHSSSNTQHNQLQYYHQQQYYHHQRHRQHQHQYQYPNQQHRYHQYGQQRNQKTSSQSSKTSTVMKTSATPLSILKQPKPPRSAFICFKDSKKKEIMKQEGTSKGKDLLNTFAQAWGQLSDKERAYWDEAARNDKVRYVQEKAAYKGPWTVPKKRAKKNPRAPKRPMSAFLKYSKTRRKNVKEENPNVSNTDVSRLLGELWRNASEVEKAPYVEAELKERNKYKEEMKKWRAEEDQLGEVIRSSHDSVSQIFRDGHHHHHQEHDSISHSKPKLQQYDSSAFERFHHENVHFESLNNDNFMEDSSKRSAFRPRASHQYQLPHCMTSEHFSSDSYHQPSWNEQSLHQSLDNDSDLLPVAPKMLPPLQIPQGGNEESTRSIYFSDSINVPHFSRYP